MRGLDPRIHLTLHKSHSFLMDGRVKPAHDESVGSRYTARR
jgi:hypothetical protein